MKNNISNIDNLMDSLLLDLEYVVRISTLYGLIRCRAYIEKILYFILQELNLNNDLPIAEKINHLAKKKISKGRMITNYLNYTENLKVNHKRIYRIIKVLGLLQDQIVPKPENYQ